MENKKFRLPKPFAEKWLAALRSGKYEQGLFVLHSQRENTYCCLGVACAIHGCKDLGDSQYLTKGVHGLQPKNHNILDLIPAELQHDNTNALVDKLTILNDEGKSFSEIADWLEENVDFYETTE
jgi:hypothetical protein